MINKIKMIEMAELAKIYASEVEDSKSTENNNSLSSKERD